MVVEKVGAVVNPFLSDKGGSLLRPVLNCMFKPVIKAFIHAVKGFHTHMSSKISSNEFAPARFDGTLEYTNWQMDWWSGPLQNAYHTLFRMYNDDFASVVELLVGGINPCTVYNMVVERLRIVVHRAVFTFGSLAKSIAESELGSVLSHVTGLLVHDCIVMIRSVVLRVFRELLSAPLQELVLKPCRELILPLQVAVDAIPIPGLNLLLDLNVILEDVIYGIRDSSLNAIIAGGVAEIKEEMELASNEIGIQSISL